MNKKKAVYTSLTALALASFSATTFADEVAETAVTETTVALADEVVAEDDLKQIHITINGIATGLRNSG